MTVWEFLDRNLMWFPMVFGCFGGFFVALRAAWKETK